MGLSKTEKLLAAKKKLKEFQLNKVMHAQDSSTKACNNVLQTTLPEVKKVVNNIQQVNQELVNTSCSRHKDIEIKKFDLWHQSEAEECNKSQQDVDYTYLDVAETSSFEKHSEIDEERALEGNIIELGNRYAEEMSMPFESDGSSVRQPSIAREPAQCPDSVIIQKEHLLEMASVVEDTLTCNLEEGEKLSEDLGTHNGFLTSYFEEQKQEVNTLHIQLNHYRSKVSELESAMATKETQFEARLLREVSSLKEQLQAHVQTTGILIAEKTELNAELEQIKKSGKQSSEEVEELSTKLRQSQLRVTELEMEVARLRTNAEDVFKENQRLQCGYQELEYRCSNLRKEKEDLDVEMLELRQKLNLRKTELTMVQQELQEKTALLSLNELRVKQLSSASHTLENQHHAATALEQQLAQSREALRTISEEKEDACKQYQSYIRQLDAQHAKLNAEYKIQNKIVADAESREHDYVKRIAELEREKSETLLPLQDDRNQVESLLRNIDELTLEQERLHITLSEKNGAIESLTQKVKELQEVSYQGEEASKLVQALESERVGASRAVLQNQQLKQQLNEMENAFVTLSNAKLELTEQLQAERNIGRKLNAKLNDLELQIEKLKEHLKEKEESLAQIQKENFQTAQIADQMQHYQVQSQHAHTLQKELQNSLICIETLKREKAELMEKLSGMEQGEACDVEQCRRDSRGNDFESQEFGSIACPGNNCSLQLIKRLEERFKETMDRVAELMDEKHKLEHLVLQLQSETETIGEYIALYQKQRAVLQSKAKEKEQAFHELLEQRNQQQQQLHKLKVLVMALLQKQAALSDEVEQLPDIEKTPIQLQKTNLMQEHCLLDSLEDTSTNMLLDLLRDIKDCKDMHMLDPNFHPCPWCSGKLITV
ncbi:hypothetical protein KM043_016920 [Ampulex compressa]|nr:hypothetical protein KM043_016920 [Ampulex compressa]